MRTVDIADTGETGFDDAVWSDVIEAVDRTYSELVAYQEKLEHQNRELDDLRRFMNSVFQSVSDLLIVVGRDNRIEQTGGSFDRLMAGQNKTVTGEVVDRLFTSGSRPVFTDAIEQAILTREFVTVEIEILTVEGPAPLELSIAPRLNERGKSVGAVIVGRPLGELRRAYSELAASHKALKEAQAHLVRNEKLASLGRLVAGVAHELNNPISFVYASTHAMEKYATRFETYFEAVQAGATRDQLIAMRGDLGLDRALKNMREAISGAKDGAERVRDIVEDLRRLSSEGPGEAVEFDLVTTTRTAADWVVRGTKTPVQVKFEGDMRPVARGNPGHIQQIVMNLVQNAIDAVADTDNPQVTLTHDVAGERAVLKVRDNGPGIPEDVAASIFDPFFTTKAVGKGTGLGLSISSKIAQEHGGDLHLSETDQPGTCFCLDLPLGGQT
ncbi:ATP-binding protein [uncultured Roseovarius sp.]|uniref:sensor histidine kinase n=1 Tax=uncultured Roseovarius sp. TaxID=293344 RepID=UPI00261BCD35|nr:ATP-binding protein [uncultured Roseovarius sp.]